MDAYVRRYRAMNYIRDHKREVPLADYDVRGQISEFIDR